MRKKSSAGFLLAFAFFVVNGAHSVYAEKISFNADTMYGNTGAETEYTRLEKNAHIRADAMEIYADKIELTGTDYRFISAEGAVRGKNTQSGLDFSCTMLKYDRKTKIIVLEGSVSMKDSETDVDAKAQRIEYDQNTDTAVMQIGVKLLSKNSVCTAAMAVYRKNQKNITMTGSPKVVRGSDDFRAQEIILNIETEEITLDGKVRGSVSDNSE